MGNTNLTVDQLNNMSDDDFDKLVASDLFDDEGQEDEADQGKESEHNSQDQGDDNPNDDNDHQDGEGEDGTDGNDNDAQGSDNQNDQEDDPEQEEENENGNGDEGNDNPVNKENNTANAGANGKTKQQPKEEKPKTEVKDTSALEFFEKVTSTFKANGKDYTITSPEEVIGLMQKGLNYHAKMNTIKPFMTAGRILEEHNLLDNPEQLAFLIDLHNKKPEAIAKLVKESGVDTFDIDDEKLAGYKPTPIEVPSENTIALQDMIKTYKDDEAFMGVYQDASYWDDVSQNLIANNPHTLETLTAHKKNGVYDAIMAKVNHARDVQGNKTPVANLYFMFGDQMYGGKGNAQQQEHQQQNKAPASTPGKVTKRIDPNLETKRKNLGGVKNVANKGNAVLKTEEDIFNLSDEEFDKLQSSKLV